MVTLFFFKQDIPLFIILLLLLIIINSLIEMQKRKVQQKER